MVMLKYFRILSVVNRVTTSESSAVRRLDSPKQNLQTSHKSFEVVVAVVLCVRLKDHVAKHLTVQRINTDVQNYCFHILTSARRLICTARHSVTSLFMYVSRLAPSGIRQRYDVPPATDLTCMPIIA